MSKTMIPQNYTPALNLYDTQRAIGTVKRLFADTLCATLNLYRVSAPLFLEASTGLNDDLNGVERKVTFDIRDSGIEAQVVQSLAKWKRKALKDYGFRVGKGLYCDMNAIRRDEELDNLHSVYVDQWDWEKVIDESTRNEAYLKDTVRRIVSAICGTLDELKWQFSSLDTDLCRDVFFLTAQELEEKITDKTKLLILPYPNNPTGAVMRRADLEAVARVVELSVCSDGELISSLSGDGVLVSTPTGSTAYSLSAGGPIVEPTAQNIIITPICAHILQSKSFVLSKDRTVEIRLGRQARKTAYLSVDGGRAIRLSSGDLIRIRRSERSISLVRLTGRSFYQILLSKLGKS